MIINELKQHGREDFPFELYRVDESHPKYEMAFHWHANLELIWVKEGELTLTLDNRQLLLTHDEIAVVNSETVHGATPKKCVYECLVFNLAFLKTNNRVCDAFLDDLLSRNAFLYERPTEKSVLESIRKVFRAIASDATGAEFKVLSAFYEFLGEMQSKNQFTSHLPPTNGHDEKKVVKLKTVLKYIREHFADQITLEDMSAVAGFSSKYFCKFFKSTTGTTPINYLTTYRIERAARKLLGSDLSITQIAYDCGFNDVSYFIKTFKTHKHTTPKEYRAR